MQTFTGIVTSSKTPQTVRVEVNYIYKHPKYKKTLIRKTGLLVHNELPEIKVGDRVEIVKSRPYSRLKHFKVTRIVK
jgi:small subunit ribosomal protein S17